MMEKLPNEILEIILSSPGLSFENILNFGATSKYFNNFVRRSSYIWKKKYQQRFPQFLKLFDAYFTEWYAEILYMNDLLRRSRKLLSTMPPQFYTKNQLSECDFAEWLDLVLESPRAYHYIGWELFNILNDCSPINSIKVVPIDTPGNKTFQYYAVIVLRFIRQKYLTNMWHQFEQLPLQEQLLEKGATFIAQWCQPVKTFEWEDIAEQLDELSKEVIMEVGIYYPNHHLLEVSEETLLNWKLHNLESNQWNVVQCRQIMQCLISVLYIRHKFNGNSVAYYMPENSYINEVLSRKQGLPITLAVIFESIARRVGLKCEPFSFPSHFLLKFTEGNGEKYAESYYIDVFNNGNIIRKGCCPRNSHGFAGNVENPHHGLEVATPLQVVKAMIIQIDVSYQQMARTSSNITTLRSIEELRYCVNSEDGHAVRSLVQFYVFHRIDMAPLVDFIQKNKPLLNVQLGLEMYFQENNTRNKNITESITKLEPKVRSTNLKFAVGMVMKHRIYNYTCVIYDWDLKCNASIAWQNEMGVQKLSHSNDQPFYNVLAEDGTHRYAAQENLIPTNTTGFLYLNEEIGKHFSHFFNIHYIPNAEKEQKYPNDAQVRKDFYMSVKHDF